MKNRYVHFLSLHLPMLCATRNHHFYTHIFSCPASSKELLKIPDVHFLTSDSILLRVKQTPCTAREENTKYVQHPSLLHWAIFLLSNWMELGLIIQTPTTHKEYLFCLQVGFSWDYPVNERSTKLVRWYTTHTNCFSYFA